MKDYKKPTIEITRIDSGESIMQVSSANINTANIVNVKDISGTGVNTINWHS